MNLKGRAIRLQWRLTKAFRRTLHAILPSLHAWEDFELPSCYPCCGEGLEDVVRVCRYCHKVERR